SYWKVYLNTGNGFNSTSVNWSLPAGGQLDGGVNQGFNLLSAIGYDTNADTWSTVDINGDAFPDLVCTGTRAANGYVTEFSPANNSYWKVYLQQNTSAVDELANANALLVYPNPARDRLVVQGEAALGEVVLHDAVGRVVLSQRAASDRAHVDVSALPPGVYVLSVRNSEGTRTARVVVE
ncbi:MAG: T9SS type A sorting domain-containing protein, partial [Flavobacteriales bacterium]|nr:T9SS type A sorting domain-containing protein [Flavobacteriales bacterium]